MSLAIGLCYKDQFVIVSNDSKVIIANYLPGGKIDLDSVKETNIKTDKVKLLTDKVLISITGFTTVADFIFRELRKEVKPENDLNECAEVLKELINGLVDLDSEDKEYLDFATKSYTINLFGFTHDGKTGAAEYNSFTNSVDLLESPLEGNRYPIIIQSPDPENDRKEMYPYLSLPAEYQTFDMFMQQIVTVHAYLSSKHKKSVSTDCKFHILYKGEGQVHYTTKTVETLDFYDELQLEKE